MASSAYGWYTMPFGKHKDLPISQVPTSYLTWVLFSCETPDEDLRFHIQQELAARAKSSSEQKNSNQERPYSRSSSRLPVAVDVTIAAEIVKEGRRALALRYHPDKGGDGEKMTLVNATADHMEKKLTALLGIGGAL